MTWIVATIGFAIIGATIWAEYLERTGDDQDHLEALSDTAPAPRAVFWVDGFPPG